MIKKNPSLSGTVFPWKLYSILPFIELLIFCAFLTTRTQNIRSVLLGYVHSSNPLLLLNLWKIHSHSTYVCTQNSNLLTVRFTRLNLFVLDCFLQVISWLHPHPVPSAWSKKLDNKLVVHSVKVIYIESEKVLISNNSPCCSPVIIPSLPLARNLSPF